jgi:hypothetical protein
LPRTIPLDRRFEEWRNGELSDPELRSRFRLSRGSETWNDVLAKPRVVILAEAGSGKTEEMKEQARLQSEAGAFAFYATVQDVGHRGLPEALRPAARQRFNSWRAGDRPAWFFIDSIDEAKLDGIRLERALGQLATAIYGAEGRAHIILSGRLTDWEFRRDLKRLDDELPMPADRPVLPPPTADDVVVSTIRDERPNEDGPKPETPLVVVMMPLDPERVRVFAEAKRIDDLDAFIAEIESANLWRFARRPLDLQWMVQFWIRHRIAALVRFPRCLRQVSRNGFVSPILTVPAVMVSMPSARSRPWNV